MFAVKHRVIFYWISGLIMAASVVAIALWGLNLGIDFKGGSLLEVEYTQTRPAVESIRTDLNKLDIGSYSIRTSGEKGYILRTPHLQESERVEILSVFSKNSTLSMEEKRFDSVGPLLGKESRNKSIVSILIVILAIIAFIAYAFRKVSEPVSSLKYGLIAIVALVHDVLVPTGVFAALGHFKGVEIDTLYITALLVILGFSIHDTIVVFDRVREHLKHEKGGKKSFEHIVGDSISETITRSINTTLTVVICLVILLFIGSDSIKYFILAMLVGMIVGTYSSIFLGSPLLVTVEKWQRRKG